MNKAVFLDRDGTINFDYSHVFDPERIQILDGVSESIESFQKAGYLVIIITNQSCLGRGMATNEQVRKTNEKILDLLIAENKNAKIDSILIAPDHPDKPTERRKPNPGMLFEAKSEFNIDLSKSWVIGDKETDPLTGVNAGISKTQCLLVHCNQTLDDPKLAGSNFQKFQNLKEASKFVLTNALP
jgi:D-glycero-D-manno-heptose 1,7-bisphosphate phosphatase